MSEFTLILATGLGLGALYFLAASGLSLIYGSWACSTSPTAPS